MSKKLQFLIIFVHIPVYHGGQFYCWRKTEYHEENHRPAYIMIFGELNINLELPPHWPYERERERERDRDWWVKKDVYF